MKKRTLDWVEDHIQALKKRSGSNSGKIWTEQETVSRLLSTLMLMGYDHYSPTAACQRVAAVHGVSDKLLHRKLNQYLHDGTIELATGATRGFASTPYYANLVELTSDHQTTVEERMGEWSKNGESVTKRMIQRFLKEEFDIEITMNRIAHYLQEWGCEYERVREIAPVDPVWHARRIGRFIVQYHRAMKEEAEEIAVIVYTDESYIHSNHACQESWFPAGSNHYVVRSRRTGRLVIIHAITVDGLLYFCRCPDDADLRVPTKNAEYIYQVVKARATTETAQETVATAQDKKDDKEDYHGNIHSEMWFTV
jgi:transposase